MFAVFQPARNLWRWVLPMLGVLGLAACEPIDLGGFGGDGQSINPNKAVPVALLIPRGSGNGSDDVLAQSLENAALMAASELQGVEIDLRVYPTGGNAQTAAARAQQAVDEGAKIILGPVFAESANAAGVAVADDNVNVLTFSNNTSIAGGNVFLLGNTFENTARRLSSFARSRGKSNVLVVYGNDVSGAAGRDAIVGGLSRAGNQVAGTVPYELSQQGVSNAIPQITSAVRGGGVDAVFLTSTSSGALPLYATLLPEAGIDPAVTQMIGLTRWDIPGQNLSLSGLQGGWFAVPDPNRTATFSSRYTALYGSAPHPIGSLAFDGIAAIGALVARGDSGALTRGSLTQSAGFQGAGGVFRFLSDGTNQRALAVATAQNGQRVIVDPAPAGFGGF